MVIDADVSTDMVDARERQMADVTGWLRSWNNEERKVRMGNQEKVDLLGSKILVQQIALKPTGDPYTAREIELFADNSGVMQLTITPHYRSKENIESGVDVTRAARLDHTGFWESHFEDGKQKSIGRTMPLETMSRVLVDNGYDSTRLENAFIRATRPEESLQAPGI